MSALFCQVRANIFRRVFQRRGIAYKVMLSLTILTLCVSLLSPAAYALGSWHPTGGPDVQYNTLMDWLSDVVTQYTGVGVIKFVYDQYVNAGLLPANAADLAKNAVGGFIGSVGGVVSGIRDNVINTFTGLANTAKSNLLDFYEALSPKISFDLDFNTYNALNLDLFVNNATNIYKNSFSVYASSINVKQYGDYISVNEMLNIMQTYTPDYFIRPYYSAGVYLDYGIIDVTYIRNNFPSVFPFYIYNTCEDWTYYSNYDTRHGTTEVDSDRYGLEFDYYVDYVTYIFEDHEILSNIVRPETTWHINRYLSSAVFHDLNYEEASLSYFTLDDLKKMVIVSYSDAYYRLMYTLYGDRSDFVSFYQSTGHHMGEEIYNAEFYSVGNNFIPRSTFGQNNVFLVSQHIVLGDSYYNMGNIVNNYYNSPQNNYYYTNNYGSDVDYDYIEEIIKKLIGEISSNVTNVTINNNNYYGDGESGGTLDSIDLSEITDRLAGLEGSLQIIINNQGTINTNISDSYHSLYDMIDDLGDGIFELYGNVNSLRSDIAGVDSRISNMSATLGTKLDRLHSDLDTVHGDAEEVKEKLDIVNLIILYIFALLFLVLIIYLLQIFFRFIWSYIAPFFW